MHNILLRHAIPLVQIHGFTRQALSIAATSLPTPHPQPLSDTAVSALFGPGDEARKTLIRAWLNEGINRMGRRENDEASEKIKGSVSLKDALKDRLRWNEPVLHHLPEAFALLSIPQTLPLLDLLPALSHPMNVANEACTLAGDPSIGTSWYAQRVSLALIYTATGNILVTSLVSLLTAFTELHQLTSPKTATQFLDTLLESSDRARDAVADAGQIAEYLWRSWAAIIKSKGLT